MSINCFDELMPHLSDEYKRRIKPGMSESELREVGLKLAEEEYQKIHEDLNGFKKSIGVKTDKYVPPFGKVQEVNDKYDKLISEHNAIPQEVHTAAATIKPETADKIVADNAITAESLPEIEHLFNDSPYSPEDLENIKTELNDKSNTTSAGAKPEGEQQDTGSTDNPQSSDAGETEASGEGLGDKNDTSESGSPKEVKTGKYTDKYKKIADNLRKADIPSWLVNSDPTFNKQGISGEAIKEALAKAIETVGKLLDKGMDMAEAIKQGAEDIISALKDLHGKDLSPEFTQQIKVGFENDVKNKYAVDSYEYTSIKNKVVNDDREDKGKSALNTATGKTDENSFNETKAKIESGEISIEHMRDVAHAIAADDPKAVTNLSATEIQHVLLYDRNTLHNEAKDIENKIIEAHDSKDEQSLADLQVKKAQNELLQDDNDLAAAKSGTELSKAFRARKLGIKNDYSLAALTRKYKAAGDGTIPESVKSKLDDYSKIIESKDAKIAEIEQAKADADAEIQQLKDINDALKAKKDSFKKLKDEVAAEQKQAKQTNQVETKDTLRKEREVIKASLQDKWKKFSRGSLNAGIPIPVEMIPDLVRLAKNYIKEGAVTLDAMVDKVHDFVSEFMVDVDKTGLRDAITGYGKIKKPNTDPVEKIFRNLTAEGRLVSSIERAYEKLAPLKSGAQRDEVTKEIRDLRKQLNKALKDNDIQVVDPEKQMKSALDGAKTRLRNQIEDLTEAIKNNEKIKKDHTGIEYDTEGKQLQADRDAIRAEYDEIFGTTKELTDEQRIDRAEKAIKKGLQKLHDRIDNNDVSVKKNPAIISENLTKLRAEREELKKVYKQLLDTSGELNRRKVEALKKSLAKRTAYLNEIKNTGNVDKFLADRVKKKTALDYEAIRAKAEQQKVKNDVDGLVKRREFDNIGSLRKGIHWGGQFAKGVLISDPVILVRILGSVLTRAIYKAPTEVSGYTISKLFPGLAKGAHGESIIAGLTLQAT